MLCKYSKNNEACKECVCRNCDHVNTCPEWQDLVFNECDNGCCNAILYCNKGVAPQTPDLFLLNKKEIKLFDYDKDIRNRLLAYGGVLFECRDCGRWTGSNEGFWLCGTTGVCDKCLEERFRRKFRDCRCSNCGNLSFVCGGLSCNGYGSFNKWAEKCRDEKIKGRFKAL